MNNFTDPVKAIEFLHDTDMVPLDVVDNYIWDEDHFIAACVNPSKGAKSLRLLTREELLDEADVIFAVTLEVLPDEEDAVELIAKWFG